MSISQTQSGVDKPDICVPKEHRLSWRGFMRSQMALPESDVRWKAMCEALQRSAHGFQPSFSSAAAHMIATPKSERMDPREAPATSFIFVDDIHDSNFFGHIVGKWGMGDGTLENIPVVTNDVNDDRSAYDAGNVTIVPLGWFPANWGDSIQFATTWFGGTEIPTFVPQSGKDDTEEWIKVSIERAKAVLEMMRRARHDNDEAKFPRHEKAIQREIDAQLDIIKSLRELLP
jgi:hypothetical protein